MENASRALVMAGGVLISLIIIGALILSWNTITSFQTSKVEEEEMEQIIYTNNEFSTYDRTNVRGNDIISLINKVIEYNNTNSNSMEIEINISNLNNFSYSQTNQYLIKKNTYDQDSFTSSVLDEAYRIETLYGGVTICSKLSTNIFNIVDATDDDAIDKVNEIVNNENNVSNVNELKTVQENVRKYYEYTQFKRAYFDCISMEYDQYGRIIYLEYEFNGTFN